MGGSQVQSTQTTESSNPMVRQTLDQLLGGVQDAWKKGPQPFDESLYGGVGDTTQQGWESALTAARNPRFTSGLNGAMDYSNRLIGSGGLTGHPGGDDRTAGQWGDLNTTRGIGGQFGQLAAGQGTPGLYESTMLGTAKGDNLNGNDPLFQRDLSRTLDTAGAGVNAAIGAGGRFGSGMHVDTLGKTLGGISDSALLTERNNALDRQQQALAGIGGERQQRFGNQMGALGAQAGQAGSAFGMEQQGIANQFGAASSLPGLFRSSLLPSTIMGSVGSAQDADRQARLMGRYDQHQRTTGAQTDLLAKLSSILNGNAQAGGTTTTNTQPGTPWWQSLLGAGVAGLGAFL